MMENSDTRNQSASIFAQPVRTLSAEELTKVVGGAAAMLNKMANRAIDNQSKDWRI